MANLIGKEAPEFEASAVVNGSIVSDFSLEQYRDKQYVVLFFYPKDFTFVCPTELIAFQKAMEQFEARNTAVIGCSTDSEFSHKAWTSMPLAEGGIKGVTYPLVADTNKMISYAYDVLAGDFLIDEEDRTLAGVEGEMVAYRGLFIMDKQGIVQHQMINNMPLGRSVSEVLRIIDALQHFEQHGEVCPMNWQKGESAMAPTPEATAQYLAATN